MTLSSRRAKEFIIQLSQDYPQFKFKRGQKDHWSPKTNTIIFNPDQPADRFIYGVLHELSHALLGHNTYQSDFELLKLESNAWDLAGRIGRNYKIMVDEEHVQNCLDTYRDWLHRRSSCPRCGTHVLQRDSSNYHCFNCHTVWKVSSGRFVRPYRKKISPAA